MKWVNFIVGILLLTSCETSSIKQFDLSHFHFEYTNPVGQGEIELSYGKAHQQDYLKFEVEKLIDGIKIKAPGINLHLENVPSALQNADELLVDGLEAHMNKGIIDLSLQDYSSTQQNSTQILKELSLRCAGDGQVVDLMDSVISSCIKKMQLGLYRYDNGDNLEILNAKINIVKGKVYMEGDIYSDLNGRFKLDGSVEHLSSEKKLRFKIDKVKFGILNVTGKFFKELEKQQSDKLQVNRPYVTFLL